MPTLLSSQLWLCLPVSVRYCDTSPAPPQPLPAPSQSLQGLSAAGVSEDQLRVAFDPSGLFLGLPFSHRQMLRWAERLVLEMVSVDAGWFV